MVTQRISRWIIPVISCLAIVVAGCNSEGDLFMEQAAVPQCEATSKPPFVALSKDGGQQFTRSVSSSLTGVPDYPHGLFLSRSQPGLMYVPFGDIIYQSTDGGCNWQVVLTKTDAWPGFYDFAVSGDDAYALRGGQEWSFTLFRIDAAGESSLSSTPDDPDAYFSSNYIASTPADEGALYFNVEGDSLWRRASPTGQWEKLAEFDKSVRLRAISPQDRRHMFFKGLLNSTIRYVAFISFDAGSSLQEIVLPQGTADRIELHGVLFDDDGAGIWGFATREWLDAGTGAVTEQESLVLFSTDSGMSFQHVFSPPDFGLPADPYVTLAPGSGSRLLMTEGTSCRADGNPRIHSYEISEGALSSRTVEIDGVNSFGTLRISPFNRKIVYAAEVFGNMCATTAGEFSQRLNR